MITKVINAETGEVVIELPDGFIAALSFSIHNQYEVVLSGRRYRFLSWVKWIECPYYEMKVVPID